MWVRATREGAEHDAAQVWFDPGSERVELGDDLFMYADTQIRVRGWEHDIDINISVHDGRLIADRVDVRRHAGSPPVTSEVFRRLPVQMLVTNAANAVHYGGESVDSSAAFKAAWPTHPEAEYVARHGLDDETLRVVARVYRVAYLVGQSPVKTIENLLKVPRSTAGRWVAAARGRGFLSEARGPGKAGG